VRGGTDKGLVDLLVGVLHTAATGDAGADIAAAVAETEDEALVCASELHVSFQTFREVDAWIFRRQV
jgi:hypothetical protein